MPPRPIYFATFSPEDNFSEAVNLATQLGGKGTSISMRGEQLVREVMFYDKVRFYEFIDQAMDRGYAKSVRVKRINPLPANHNL